MPAPTSPSDSTPAVAPKVYLGSPDGDVPVTVEVVSTPAKVERGLMFREHLPPDDGMLFIMTDETDHAFWMKNTLISLDIIFIGSDMKVAGISANAEPRNLKLLKVGAPSHFVLEVNGGWAAKHKVAAGSTVRFENVKY